MIQAVTEELSTGLDAMESVELTFSTDTSKLDQYLQSRHDMGPHLGSLISDSDKQEQRHADENV